ncbi:MAG: PAS domain-containing protein, partial [Planctomycetota bacterium]
MPFIPEPYRAQVRGELESLSKESPATTIENPVLLDNGELRWHQWTNRAIFDENGQIVQYQSVGRDITERKRAEEALRQERDRAQRYLDVAGVMFVALNAKGEVALINQKGSEVLGYEQVEIIGKNWFDSFLPVSAKDQVGTAFDRLMAGEIEPVEYYENPVLTKGGEERIIAWHNTTLKDDEDNIIGTLASGEDITER